MGALRYKGTDPENQWIPGVPARDLTAEEAEAHPEARESPLYEEVGENPTPAPAGRRRAAETPQED